MSETKRKKKAEPTSMVRLRIDLAARVNAIEPLPRRAAWVERAFDLVPLPAEVDAEPGVARALSEPAEPVCETPLPGAEPEATAALVRRSLALPIPLADSLDNISDQRHAVEMLVAVAGDLAHADRVHAVLNAHSEVVQIARDLRELVKMFGASLSPRLAMHLRYAAHLWAGKLLKSFGEEPPAMALPVPAQGTNVAPKGVPGHWEPVMVWMPLRLHHRVAELQATLTQTLATSDATWESIVGEFFVNERQKQARKNL